MPFWHKFASGARAMPSEQSEQACVTGLAKGNPDAPSGPVAFRAPGCLAVALKARPIPARGANPGKRRVF